MPAPRPSLVERLEQATSFGGAITFAHPDGEVAVPWAQLHDEARAVAGALQARGIAPGDHVAVLAPTSRALVTTIQATWLAGAALVVLPLPMRLSSVEEFARQTRARTRRADTALLVVDDQLAPFVTPEPGDPPTCTLDDLRAEAAGRPAWRAPHDDPDRLAILQFTSGSTAEPKGVMLPGRVLCANLDAITEAGRIEDADVFVSWLPLYHDMGLVGMLATPMTTGRPLVLGAPQDFLGQPARWLRWLSDHRGTVTAGPNFSWVLATRALRRMDGLDLSALRIALNGAEPVDPRTVRDLLEAGAPHGLRPEAAFPAFGMAEVGIGATFSEPLAGLRVDHVDRDRLEGDRQAVPAPPGAEGTRELVRLGRAVPGLEVRVVDPETGAGRTERQVGEVEVRGDSVTPGYYRDEAATAAAFRGEWLRTGDLGYLVDGELVVCGRIKDVIVVGGRNVFPQDIEWAVAEVDGIRAGNVIAFGVSGDRGKEHVVVVAEHRLGDGAEPGDEELALLRKHAHQRATEVSGLPPRDVVLVPRGTLPKTSSGKLQRAQCRQRYLAGELVPA